MPIFLGLDKSEALNFLFVVNLTIHFPLGYLLYIAMSSFY